MPKNAMKFEKFLTVSTGHMTKNDDIILTHGIVDLDFSWETLRYGYLLYLHPKVDLDLARKSLSSGLCDMISKCMKEGCFLLRLDPDGDTYRQFAYQDW